MGLRRATRRLWRRLAEPAIGDVDFGQLRTLKPVSPKFGLGRGMPVDRHFIETFLNTHASDIRGTVLEVADARYTNRIGGPRVVRVDVLHPRDGNPRATVIGDLATGAGLKEEAYDCVIVTQTLQYIFDVSGAVDTLFRILRPEGVLLLTVPTTSQKSRADAEAWGEYWRFTAACVARLLAARFDPRATTVNAHGNVLLALAFLEGLAAEDLTPDELSFTDPDYELVVTARAKKGLP